MSNSRITPGRVTVVILALVALVLIGLAVGAVVLAFIGGLIWLFFTSIT